MKTVGIIPARIGSDVVPAKVLTDLGGKPVIQHVYERTIASPSVDAVLIAADDQRIMDIAEEFGARTFRSRQNHVCGSDRCAEAAQAVFPDAEVVVNVQADEPFLNTAMISRVVEPLLTESEWDMTTLCCPCPDDVAANSPFNVKVVRSMKTSRAIYFSRAVIPFPRDGQRSGLLQHIGIYGYRACALQQFADFGPSELELTEGLEQLRALEAEMRIKVIVTEIDYPRISIDTHEDLEKARQFVLSNYSR
jgi:3-deoxy-manno-octulosonate cytidylyltransferase (CMP-KDO synthetase)